MKDYMGYSNRTQCYITSYEVLKEEHTIEVIYEGEFETIEDLRRMEGHYIRDIDCVNRQVSGRTHKEWEEDNKINIVEKT